MTATTISACASRAAFDFHALLLGASGFALTAKSEFDGFDPFTFLHADTLDETRNRLGAGRLFAELGNREKAYAVASASLLGSSNRNELDGDFLNETEATRRTQGLEGGYRVGHHRLIAAIESEHERFEADDVAFGGFTDQDRSRNHQSLTVEWRGEGLGPIDAGLAIRQDIFSRFKDATSFRASIKASISSSFAIATNYGEGIAQPTFFDLYGFFPGSFVGNPGLKPESSRGGEISLRYSTEHVGGSVTYFRQRLKDESPPSSCPTSPRPRSTPMARASGRASGSKDFTSRPTRCELRSLTPGSMPARPDVAGGRVKGTAPAQSV